MHLIHDLLFKTHMVQDAYLQSSHPDFINLGEIFQVLILAKPGISVIACHDFLLEGCNDNWLDAPAGHCPNRNGFVLVRSAGDGVDGVCYIVFTCPVFPGARISL